MSKKTLKSTLIVVSILLACALGCQGLYMAGVLPGRNTCDPETVCASLPAPAAEEETAKSEETSVQQAEVADASCAKPDYTSKEDVPGSLFHDGYTLEKVVVLSRHNIRSPLSSPDSLLGKITPHEWFKWSSGTSELSLRGGALETNMGHFFRKWLEAEKLFPENFHPEEGQIRFYANSKQRTIATAQYFLAGLLPTANLDVEYHAEFDKMDPVFNPVFTFLSDSYQTAVSEQQQSMFADTIASLSDNYELVSDVIDIQDSTGWKDGTVVAFNNDDNSFVYEVNKEPGVNGSLKTATNVVDALVLQYYEEPDPVAAAFGNSLTTEQWKDISEIKDVYGDVLFTPPLISLNIANPLLKEIYAEMNEDDRIFTFLCGHDSNVGSVLSALNADDYSLPNTLEPKTPIGVKMVFSKFTNADKEVFWAVDLVYQTTNQLRNLTLLDLDTHPAIVPVAFKDLERNADGLYPEQALMERFTQSIGEYDKMVEEYAAAPAE